MKHDHFIITSRGKVRRRIDKNAIIAQYLSSFNGRSMLKSAMISPLKRNLNYSGIAREVFAVEPMPPPSAAVFYYDTLEEEIKEEPPKYKHKELIVNSRGKIGQKSKLNNNRIVLPLFEIVSNPTVKISDIRKRRFNLIDRYTPFIYQHKEFIISSKGKVGIRNKARFNLFNAAVLRARNEIMAQEDANVFKLLDELTDKQND